MVPVAGVVTALFAPPCQTTAAPLTLMHFQVIAVLAGNATVPVQLGYAVGASLNAAVATQLPN